jgi:hypothetical protein
MSGSFQSHDYVPGKSGLKIDLKTGEFEINSCTLGITANAPERQMVSVEVASWSKYDLPKNAANLLQFMQAELQRVPEQYRHAAEFEEFDASYGDDSFNSRLFLSYSRLETEEELADRLEKAKASGTRIVSAGGCTTIVCDGVVRARFGNLDQPEPEPEQPFKLDGCKPCINQAFIDAASVTQAGTLEAALSASLKSQFLVASEKFAIKYPTDFERKLAGGLNAVLDALAGKIGDTKLGYELKEQIDVQGSNLADQVKAVIRKELMPGGLLHRSR